MKGILHKTEDEKWVVQYRMANDMWATDGGEIPVYQEHFNPNTKCQIIQLVEGKEVEFEMIRNPYIDTIFAKLIPMVEQTNGERLDEFTEKTIGLCDIKPPYVFDDFQIGPNGAYELGCSYPDCICQGNEITECKNRVYPELEGTMNLCNDITEKKIGKMTEEEWQAAERAQTSRMYSEEEVKSAFKKGFYRWNEPIEISDEQITKLANEHILYNDSKKQWVIEGMKLYREHLKTKLEN